MKKPIEVGTELYCNWGAMHATQEGKIVKILDGVAHCELDNFGDEDYPHKYRIDVKDIQQEYAGHGSPIGVFLLENMQ